MTYYVDPEEDEGADIWDRINKPRRLPGVPVMPEPVYVEQARGATQPRQPRPQPPVIDDTGRPPPPEVPPPSGPHRWDMDRRVPPQWQREPDKREWTGKDNTNAYDTRDRESRKQMERDAYRAGRNGDTGARDAFPPGSRMRQEYERGVRDRQQQARR